MFSGHQTLRILVIMMLCCLTCLAKGTFQIKEQAERLKIIQIGGLVLKVRRMIYFYLKDHLMVMENALHG